MRGGSSALRSLRSVDGAGFAVVTVVGARGNLNSRKGNAKSLRCAAVTEEEADRGDMGDGDGRSFPFSGYEGPGDSVYTGGGTNDAFICPESVEPSPPTSIAACRSLA
jgi:hypothetical protein